MKIFQVISFCQRFKPPLTILLMGLAAGSAVYITTNQASAKDTFVGGAIVNGNSDPSTKEIASYPFRLQVTGLSGF